MTSQRFQAACILPKKLSGVAVLLLTICLGSMARAGAPPGAIPPPRVRLLYEVVSWNEGVLYLRDLPSGERAILWEWRSRTDEWGAPALRYAVSPDHMRVVLTEERLLMDSAGRQYVFALIDLEDPWESPRRLALPENVNYVVQYPVWRDDSTVVLGVSSDMLGKADYRELTWTGSFTSPAEEVPIPERWLVPSAVEALMRIQDALRRVPEGLVPRALGDAMDRGRPILSEDRLRDAMDRGRLILSEDRLGATVQRFELLARSSVTVSPSGKAIAVCDEGRVLRIFDGTGRLERKVEPLSIFPQESIRIDELRWGADGEWLLFTERHCQTVKPPPMVMKPRFADQSLAVVRAMHVRSGTVFTLVAGENAFWIGDGTTSHRE